MNADIKQIVVFVDQADGFLLFPVVVDHLQAVELSHSMIDVGYIVARFQVV